MKENEAIRILGDTTLCTPLGQAAFVGIEAIKKVQQYRAIGTVEECREARERQRGKKPIIKSKKKTKIQTGDYVDVKCPCCEEDIFSCFHYPPWNDSQKSHKHCENCGQAIDWSDNP